MFIHPSQPVDYFIGRRHTDSFAESSSATVDPHSAKMSAPAEKNVVLQQHIIESNGAGGVVQTRMTEAEYNQHRAKKDTERQKFRAAVAKQVEENDGSDVHRNVDFPNPGKEEILKSLESVELGWERIPPEQLRLHIATGKPPQDVTQEEMKQYTEEARTIQDTNMREIIGLLPSDLRSRLPAQLMQYESLIPQLWFCAQMEKLHVRNSLRKSQDFNMGRQAAVSDAEFMWTKCVKFINGFKKTVIELQKYGPDMSDPATQQMLNIMAAMHNSIDAEEAKETDKAYDKRIQEFHKGILAQIAKRQQ